MARNGSVRGTETIRVCRLDRPDLLDSYAHHVEVNLRPDIDVVLKAITSLDKIEAVAKWDLTRRRHLQPCAIFAGLAFDAMDHFVPPSIRSDYGLKLELLH